MRRENTGAAGDGRPFSLAHVHIVKAALEVTPRNL
jgi:hypothetical protein